MQMSEPTGQKTATPAMAAKGGRMRVISRTVRIVAAQETKPGRVVVRPPRTDEEVRAFLRQLPRYRLLLHNDAVNTFDHVIGSLVTCIPALQVADAVRIAWEARTMGCSEVIVCLREQAEHYQAQLRQRSLTSSIEPA